MNLFTIFRNVAITAISFNEKYSELTISHGQKPWFTPHDTPTLDKTECVPFVITYNPSLRSISSIIHKHFHILISSPRCYNVYKAAPIVAYRRSSNLSDFIVRAKDRNFTQHNQPRGSCPCEKNCLTCKYISDGQTSYKFHSSGETRPITHSITVTPKTWYNATTAPNST